MNNLENSINLVFENKHYMKGTKKFFANSVFVLIDISKSTNNIDNVNEPILCAEIKGTIYYILEMMEFYDLTNVLFQFYTFSDDVDFVCEYKVDTHEKLFNILKQLVYMIKYKFGNTNLISGLKKICNNKSILNKSHIIIATDGQLNDKNNITTITNYISKLPDHIYKNITIAFIGAGNVEIDKNTYTGFRSFGGKNIGSTYIFPTYINPNNFKTHIMNAPIIEHDVETINSACNIGFFVKIMDILKSSVYLPAIDDYAKLVKTAKNYFDAMLDYDN